DEILAFLGEWGGRSPVVLVPTMYADTPSAVFREAGASMIIWANHMTRAIIKTMQEVAAEIFREQSVKNLEARIVPVKEIFRIQGAAELKEAEKRYLPANG
ncbi:MAG TPA: phosphoenolpyruvate mutase, partial [Acidimicrobiia bacterium]|nr:phosphoenolpyruvate mutase [Acidimicrobiia bacterium]